MNFTKLKYSGEIQSRLRERAPFRKNSGIKDRMFMNIKWGLIFLCGLILVHCNSGNHKQERNVNDNKNVNEPEINIQNNEIIEPDPMMQWDKINISNQDLIGVWMTDEYYFFSFLDNNEYLFECAGWGRAGIWGCEDNIIVIKYEDQETEIYDVEYFEDDILIIINRDDNKFPMEPHQRTLRFNREK